jgi:transposase
MARHRHELTDQEWERIEDLLPPDHGRAGRRPIENARILLKRVVEMLTRLVQSVARRSDRDRDQDRDPDRV